MSAATLRFRKPRDTADQLGQVYTPSPIAALLASVLPTDARLIVDIGAGHGALAKAALLQCCKARAVLLEQAQCQVNFLRQHTNKRSKIVQGDALVPGLIETFVAETKDPVILSNPPYGWLKTEEKFAHGKSALPPVIDGKGWVRGDVAFVSRIFDASPRGTTLGLVVASPIICSPVYTKFRHNLVSTVSNLVVTELHPNTFPGAEVRAFLLTCRVAQKRTRNVTLRLADTSGEILSEVRIGHAEAVSRLDYRYHATVKNLSAKSSFALGTVEDLGCSLSRGSRSKAQFNNLGLDAFHTTHFGKNGELIKLRGATPGFIIATSGDILIPRVGSRCLSREARVVSGSGLITDCIYRIRPPKELRKKVWETLNSDFGRQWRELFAEGSCAKYLTVSSLKALPILR